MRHPTRAFHPTRYQLAASPSCLFLIGRLFSTHLDFNSYRFISFAASWRNFFPDTIACSRASFISFFKTPRITRAYPSLFSFWTVLITNKIAITPIRLLTVYWENRTGVHINQHISLTFTSFGYSSPTFYLAENKQLMIIKPILMR